MENHENNVEHQNIQVAIRIRPLLEHEKDIHTTEKLKCESNHIKYCKYRISF